MQDGTTQEAGLFRRTNLHQCLDTEPSRTEFYPLPSQGAVYCPNMVVLRKSSKEYDEFLERPEWMSFLVSHAHFGWRNIVSRRYAMIDRVQTLK